MNPIGLQVMFSNTAMFPYTTILLTGLLVLVTAVPVTHTHPVDVGLSHEPSDK